MKPPISIRETTTKASAYFEFTADNALGAGVGGETRFWRYSTRVSPSNGNWYWADCRINVTELNKASNKVPTAQRQATIAHELGHAMGLAHRNTEGGSIMCQYLGGKRTATRANAQDCRTINHLY